MSIETLDDIVESIMDRLGIYGAHNDDIEISGDKCGCRCCESSRLRSRIEAAMEVDRKISARVDAPPPIPVTTKNKLCELFGHKISQTALLICEIKANDLNRGKPNIMKCERCGWTLDLNNKEAVDTYAQHLQERKFFKVLWNWFLEM